VFAYFQNAFLFLWLFLYNSFINFYSKKIILLNFFSFCFNLLKIKTKSVS